MSRWPSYKPFWVIAAISAAAIIGVAAFFVRQQRPAGPKNLILISIDTLRADHLGCYGYDRATSPTIDRIAKRGVLFLDASATSPWTKPSHASLLTGLYPRRHGAVEMERPMAGNAVHLAAWLSRHGYDTAAVVNSLLLTKHGLEAGFQDFKYLKGTQHKPEPSEVSEESIRWLDQRDREKPFFLFIHYFDVHSDYVSLPQYEDLFVRRYEGPVDGTTRQLFECMLGQTQLNERDIRHMADLHDSGVRQLDDQIKKLFTHLEQSGLLQDSLLVITSDHGEEFYDHGSVGHGLHQFQELIRIPLVLHAPGSLPTKRVSEPVSLVDIMPTCLAMLGVPVPDNLDGLSIEHLWQDDSATLAPRLQYFESDTRIAPGLPTGAPIPLGAHRAIRLENFKLHYNMDTRETKLFDLSRDPAEQTDIYRDRPRIAESLRDKLIAYLNSPAAVTESEQFNQAEIQALKALGYVGD